MEKVFCKDCRRWYDSTQPNQCEIPSCGIFQRDRLEEKIVLEKVTGVKDNTFDIEGIEFIEKHSTEEPVITSNTNFTNLIYAKPTELNRNNECYFYSPISSFIYLFRRKINFGQR